MKILRFRTLLLILLFLGLGLDAGLHSFAQAKKGTKPQPKPADSATVARQQAIAASRAAQQHTLDSIKTVRTHTTDSVKKVRQHISDSLITIRKYRESKKYQDSVTKSRQLKLDKMRASQKHYFDSLKAVRKKALDSTIAFRKRITDSTKAIQKKRTDSLTVIRKYKESKRFKDSVSVSRQLRMDSMRAVRKKFTDSSIASRKHILDSAKAVRKIYFDSVTAVRKKFTDSLKVIRKAKTDSLAKVKENRAKLQKANEKLREDKMKLALELKIKKKHQAWSNDKMLKKKWSVPRQVVQNTFTRYNYYFNSDKKMDEALANMQRSHRESLDSVIALFPFDPDRDSTLLASDMDSIIRKASVGIQIHDPRSKWGDDLYLLMGQAYFYKGNYENATITFRYAVSMYDKLLKKKKQQQPVKSKKDQPSIAEEDKKTMLDFMKHKTAHNEALLWLARTYTQARKYGEAESVLDLLSADSKFPESLKGRLALENAFLELKQHSTRQAIQNLAIVSDDGNVPYWLRLRASYLNGQLQQQQGDYVAAANNFRHVIDMQPKIEMDFYARKNLAYSLMLAGGDQQEAIASLKKMLNDGKYVTYYEQVYFILGQLAVNSNNTKDAITYLQKSISSPKSTKKQKALSFASLGNVYYQDGKYAAAKNAYDSAAAFAAHVPGDSSLAVAVKRSKSLNDVTIPLDKLHTQDSLLALSLLSDKEQRSAVRRYIRHLEQLRADSVYRAENAGLASAGQTEATGPDNNLSNWYFSNASLMQQGQNDFKRKWGTRPLADNWRISSLSGSGSNNNTNSTNSGTNASDNQGSSASVDLDENGFPTEESLLKFIPHTPEEQEDTRLRIQRAYIDLANAYVRQLEDYPRALQTLDSLESKYPKTQHKAEATYLRYVVALRQNKLDKAQEYSTALQQQFPSSQYTALVRPTEDSQGGIDAKQSVASYYDETYALLDQRQYTEAARRSQMAIRQYGDVRYQKKFTILESAALAASGNYNRADTLITDFMKNNPTDSLRDWAEAITQYIAKNRPAPDTTHKTGALTSGPEHPAPPTAAGTQPAAPGTTTATPPVTPVPVALDSTHSTAPAVPANYVFNAQAEHCFVFVFNKMEPKAMGVKAALTDMNSMKFSSLGLTASLDMIQGQQGMIIVRPFQNLARAKIYLNGLKTTPQVFREYSDGEYTLLLISSQNLLKLKADKNLQPYLDFYRKNYK